MLSEYSNKTVEDIFQEFKSNSNGLDSSEIFQRIKKYGKNILVEEKSAHWVLRFLGQFKNPLIIILLVASLVSFISGEHIDGLIVIVMILLSTILNFVQEYQASEAAKKLKEKLKSTALVIRNGKEIEIDIRNVVPGDILSLKAGDLIPADSRLFESNDFFVNQSTLTGESMPCEKVSTEIKDKNQSLIDLNNIVFSGTNVLTGSANAIVIETGKNTEFGKIAQDLEEREIPSEFSRGIHQFSFMIMKAILFVVATVFFISISKHDLFESFMFALAVAVGITPELLPMIMSITMGRGAMKMAKKGVIVKKLQAIPNLGSMNVLCTDKTGTLTKGTIDLVKYVDVYGNSSEQVLLFTYLNSYFQSSITNPMDSAVLDYKKENISLYKKIDEIPFDFVRKRMSVIVEDNDKNHILITKGAPENIFDSCNYYSENGSSKKLTQVKLKEINKIYEELSRQGFRVIATAITKINKLKDKYEPKDEKDLELVGFVAFRDPPKQEVKEVVKELNDIGVEIKIITGDNELVTKKICEELNIPIKGILLGSKLRTMTDDALRIAVMNNTIFARFAPDEKNRVIRALKSNRCVVGYMGDGINDAPSLKTADVSISVENAVDVAKESAEIILTKKDLRVLKEGIIEGRKTFGNSMKYIMMGISSNFGNMFSVIGAVIFIPFLPMLPLQILLNNLLYDMSQITIPSDNVDDDFVKKPKRWNIKFIQKFMIIFGLMSSIFDWTTYYLFFSVFKSSAAVFQTGWFMESLATQTFIIYVIRTKKIPFLQSTANKWVIISTVLAVATGWIIPFTPLGPIFGFAPLEWYMAGSILLIVVVYLVLVEIVKHWFYKWNEF